MTEKTSNDINIVCNTCDEYILSGVTYPKSMTADWTDIKQALVDHYLEDHPETFEYECVVCYQNDGGYEDAECAAEALMEHLKDDHAGTIRQTGNPDSEQSLYEVI